MRERCTEAWEAAAPIDLRTPARSRVCETLANELGSKAKDDLRTVLETVGTTRSGGDGSTDDDVLDEVALMLLVAASHGIQLYEISKWGKDVGPASKATFSWVKGRLEDEGVIAIKKVPTELGRSRLRLQLGDDRLHDIEAADLPTTARDILASAPV